MQFRFVCCVLSLYSFFTFYLTNQSIQLYWYYHDVRHYHTNILTNFKSCLLGHSWERCPAPDHRGALKCRQRRRVGDHVARATRDYSAMLGFILTCKFWTIYFSSIDWWLKLNVRENWKESVRWVWYINENELPNVLLSANLELGLPDFDENILFFLEIV